MNTKQNTIKYILCGLIGIILIVMAHFGVVMLKQPNFTVYADDTTPGVLPISLTNASFNSSSTKATGFKADGYISNTDSNILDLSKDKYPEAKRGSKYDNYVLCLSSTTDANYGYRSEDNNLIEINPNSFYSISVDVYTNANNSIADLYLYNGTKIFDSILDINTSYSWTTCHFYISTNDMEDFDLALGMYLNGTGTVLFDNISVNQLSEQKFLEYTTDTSTEPESVRSHKSNIVARYTTESNNFVKTSVDSDLDLTTAEISSIKNSTVLTKYTGNDEDINISYKNFDEDGINNNAIVVENTEKTYIEYHTENDFITFKQNNLYKVSLNVKAENLSGDAHFKLVRTNKDSNDK